MDKPLQILLVGDSEDGALLIEYELRKGDYSPSIKRVETPDDIQTALNKQKWDVVIVDWTLSSFNGLDALAIFKENSSELPLIIVSDNIDQETAVAAINAEADDYVTKNRLDRLIPAIEWKLREAEIRQEREQAKAILWESEERFRATFEQAAVGIAHIDLEGRWLRVNQRFCNIVGYSLEQLQNLTFQEITHPDDLDIDVQLIGKILAGEIPTYSIEKRYIHATGSDVWVNLTVSLVRESPNLPKYFIAVIEDITERKQAEVDLEKLLTTEHEQRLQAETLAEVTLSLTSQTNPANVLDEILRQVQRLVPYRTAHIMLLDDDKLRIGSWQGYRTFESEALISSLVQPLADLPLDEEAIRSRQSLVISDTYQEPRWVVREETAWVKSHLVVPICLGLRVLGLLRLDGDTVGSFSNEDVARLHPLTSSAAIALENARLFDQAQQEIAERKQAEYELQQRNQELGLLNQASQTFTSTLNLDQVLTTILDGIRHLIEVTAWSVWLVEPETNHIVCRRATDPQSKAIVGWRLIPQQGLVGWVVHHAESLVVTDTRTDERHFKEVDKHTGIEMRSILSMPLQVKQKVIGVLQVMDTEVGRFSAKDLALLEPLSVTAAIAIENAQLFEQAQQEIAERKRAEKQTQQRNRELTLLNRVIAASATTLELEQILEKMCRELALAFGLPQAVVTLLSQEKSTATVVAEYLSPAKKSMLHTTLSLSDNPVFDFLFEHKSPLSVDNAQKDPRLTTFHHHFREQGTVSMLILPLVIEGEVVGSLTLNASKLRQFSAEEISLVWRVADQMAGTLARSRLAQTSQYLTTAIEQSADSVVITNTEGTIVYVNPAFKQVSGYDRAEIIGQSMRLVKSGKHDKAFYRKLWKTLSSGQVWQGRFVNQKKDGTLYTAETSISPIRSEGGEIISYVSVQRDVTRELQLEEQYQQAQKMQAVGLLAGGIAHDFNNLLTAINGFAEMIQLELSAQDPLQELVNTIRYSGKRAADLIQQLLVFSRKQITEPKIINLNDVVSNTSRLLTRLIEENIEVEIDLMPTLWSVKIDAVQVDQVVVNLAVNARDAMPNGGLLSLKTENVIVDEAYAADHLDLVPGEYAMLTVRDNGEGMSAEVKAHIFEPFYTTKVEGKGTGLGLATVFGIVKQHSGHIWVDSELEKGTTFKVYLPRAQGVNTAKPQTRRNNDILQGTETVLLVEDEEAVRDLASYVLRRQGYTVLEATNGEDALRLTKEHTGVIDLLFTDTVMPKMGGEVLIGHFKTIRPDTKILLTSGYTDKNFLQDSNSAANQVAFIQKPFTAVELTQKVRAVLDN
jgi:PAS domain S-box-containing protein